MEASKFGIRVKRSFAFVGGPCALSHASRDSAEEGGAHQTRSNGASLAHASATSEPRWAIKLHSYLITARLAEDHGSGQVGAAYDWNSAAFGVEAKLLQERARKLRYQTRFWIQEV